MKKTGFTLIELLIASIILAILSAIVIPNFMYGLIRARESEVKTSAHALQIAIEDYKSIPGAVGLKPDNAARLNWVQANLMPLTIRNKGNPFNLAETYGTSAIVWAPAPGANGRVSYYFVSQADPYTILAQGGDPSAPVIILTLVEGQ